MGEDADAGWDNGAHGELALRADALRMTLARQVELAMASDRDPDSVRLSEGLAMFQAATSEFLKAHADLTGLAPLGDPSPGAEAPDPYWDLDSDDALDSGHALEQPGMTATLRLELSIRVTDAVTLLVAARELMDDATTAGAPGQDAARNDPRVASLTILRHLVAGATSDLPGFTVEDAVWHAPEPPHYRR